MDISKTVTCIINLQRIYERKWMILSAFCVNVFNRQNFFLQRLNDYVWIMQETYICMMYSQTLNIMRILVRNKKVLITQM